MGIYFVAGAVFSSFLLIQINFAIILSVLLLANIVPQCAVLFHVIGAIVGFLLIAGHIRATTAITANMLKKSEAIVEKAQDNEQKIYKHDKENQSLGDIFYSTLFTNIYLIAHGIGWRFKKEAQYIWRVAGFNFKVKEEDISLN
jgi:hypothetical protein